VPLVCLVLLAGLPRVAGAEPADSGPASRIDPVLATAARLTPRDSFTVWVGFRDKGEAGPADLAALLKAAEAALTPRARARRLRAGVQPLVDERDLPVAPGYLEALVRSGCRPIAVSRWLDQAAIRLPGARVPEIAALPFVWLVAPVERVRRSPDPAGSEIPLARLAPARETGRAALDHGLMQRPLDQIGVPSVHGAGFTGKGVLVTVLDDGFNFFDKHEALRHLVIPASRQRDFVRGLQQVQDTTAVGMEHGTWVLGCLAGYLPGTYVGAAYGADFALARTEIDATETTQEMLYWQMGAEWADSLGADVISSSLAYTTFDGGIGSYTYADMDGHTTVVSRAAEIAASKGILVVNAVGNLGNDPWHYLMAPSDVDGDSLIAVGAVDLAGSPAAFSSYGPSADGRIKPDLAARGVAIPLVAATGNPQAYTSLSGTSFSTPQIAGLAACLMEARPGWTPRDVVRALRATASQASAPDNRVGYGIPNGAAVLCGAPAGPAGPSFLTLQRPGRNPVRFAEGAVHIHLGLAQGAATTARDAVLEIHDSLGRTVGRPWSGVIPCGLGLTVTWDGRDRMGHHCGAGLYVVTLRSGSDRASLRLVCLP